MPRERVQRHLQGHRLRFPREEWDPSTRAGEGNNTDADGDPASEN